MLLVLNTIQSILMPDNLLRDFEGNIFFLSLESFNVFKLKAYIAILLF
ncbi:hypothetical protein SAMN04490243_1765 [Robiginitalea myxolifaciens]|uniref:Uncharacterized protein n=1 Tax=Robiginitalea myxolifaciens TaxID=400055 RepID=A0A1I6GUW6_9FLAO|nr:hypothetical protein SAMN04490243_1765 [Robiginitalea myxolifaciens]